MPGARVARVLMVLVAIAVIMSMLIGLLPRPVSL
jgi:hypothetical protein